MVYSTTAQHSTTIAANASGAVSRCLFFPFTCFCRDMHIRIVLPVYRSTTLTAPAPILYLVGGSGVNPHLKYMMYSLLYQT